MTTSKAIAVLCALCALSALPVHARVFDVRPVGEDVNPYCKTCQVQDGQRYQLIRGEDEVQQCEDHVYCDCQEQRQLKCEGWMSAWESLNPDKQECALGFRCANWLSNHPTTTSTAGPTAISTVAPTTNSPEPPTTTSSLTTTTPNPSHPYCLTCQVVGDQRYQLIRGEDELQQCEDHVYCDCVDHKQMKCGGWLGPLEWFNPDKQECVMGFSCADWLLAPTTTTTEASTTTSTKVPTTTSTALPTTTTTEIPTTTWTVAPTTTTTEIPTTTSTESPTTTSTKTPSTTSTVAPTSTSTDVPTTTSTEAFTTSSPQDPATNPTTTSTRAPFRLDSIVICRS